MKKLLRWWGISRRQKAQQSMRNIATRFGCEFFWSSYSFIMLLGLLSSGFVFGGIVVMRNLDEKTVRTTETLNFDFTKTTPVALLPLMPFSVLLPNFSSIFFIIFKKKLEIAKTIMKTHEFHQ
jgi:seipin